MSMPQLLVYVPSAYPQVQNNRAVPTVVYNFFGLYVAVDGSTIVEGRQSVPYAGEVASTSGEERGSDAVDQEVRVVQEMADRKRVAFSANTEELY